MKRIGIIIGSVREPRRALRIGEWFKRQAENDTNEYVIIDLKEINLPHYNEPGSPSSSNGYAHETTRQWSEIVNDLDGFIFVTPEYNGYFTGVLKDAIDYLYHEWTEKPYSIISYGGRGGKWAADHLSTLLNRFDMSNMGFIRVLKPWDSLDSDGNINLDFVEGNTDKVLQQFQKQLA